MGSPLGPLFANYYMAYLENTIFNTVLDKPNLYCRYVDDIFIQIDSIDQLDKIKQEFENNSVLKFTYELNINNRLPFLDTLIDTSNNNFHTTVYHKPTDHGHCLNANSECTDKYKNSVIFNYLHRAYKVSQNWSDFHTELQHVKQVLINNNYTNRAIDKQIKLFLDRFHSQLPSKPTVTQIPLYYNSQFHSNYKIEEKVIKDIIHSNVKCSDPNNK